MTEVEKTDWKKFFFSFEGRVNRKKLWMNFAIPVMLITIVLAGLDVSLGFKFGFSSLFSIATLWPKFAIGAKRLHDRELSGWWQGAPIVAMLFAGACFVMFKPLGILFVLIGAGLGIWLATQIGFLKGTDGPNPFGPDPLDCDEGCPKCGNPIDGDDLGDGAQMIEIERVGAGE